jgi:hypothetical protein
MMEVWDPKDEITVFSQIKKLLSLRTGPLTGWVVCLYPGNLVFRVKDWFLNICEVYGSKISNWGWQKRWNKINRKRYKHG